MAACGCLQMRDLTISTLTGYHGLEGTDLIMPTLGEYSGLLFTNFGQFSIQEAVVVFKGMILCNFYFTRVW